ncbi:hypothetical protein V1264_011817 [Littorina saxatilis]|uniref:Uncharacterized protein n=1 Tax=Littorina saxatilis TaxID=31220 RepID=A0AAN9BVW9_9CAEN
MTSYTKNCFTHFSYQNTCDLDPRSRSSKVMQHKAVNSRHRKYNGAYWLFLP